MQKNTSRVLYLIIAFIDQLARPARYVSVAAFIFIVAVGCATNPPGADNSHSNVAKSEATNQTTNSNTNSVSYGMQIDRFSDGDAEYSGFYNNFEYKATLLNSAIRSALLQKQNDYYQWDRDKFMKERDKSDQEAATETSVFLSFFTPDRKNDNLFDSKSIWRVYLEADGRRYQGKVKRVRSLLAELQTLYPYHTRWNTPYVLSFPVPTNSIESQNSTLTVTGPLGSKTVRFTSTR